MMQKKASLRNRILYMCLMGTLLAIVLQAVLFTYYFVKLFNEQTKVQSENSLRNLQSEIYTYVKDEETKLIEVYNESTLMRDLTNGLDIDVLREKYAQETYILKNENFAATDSVTSLYLYNRKNELISSYQKSDTKKYNYPKDIFDADYDVNAAAVLDYVSSDSKTMLVSSYYNENRKMNLIRFVLKIYKNSDTTKVIGYLVCDVDNSNFTSIMKKYVTDDDTTIWLQPAGDRYVAVIGDEISNNSNVYQQMKRLIQQKDERIENDTVWLGHTLYEQQQTKYNLPVYELVPQRAVSCGIKVMLRAFLLIGCFMVLFAAVISSKISQSISRPLENLTRTIKRIRAGEPELRVEVSDKEDEISVLGKNFDEMLDEIHALMAQKYQTTIQLERAEYLTLQAQINPHFLYNTLDTMSSIASIQDCQVVSNMSQALANIFRYALNMSESFATLADEMQHVRNFVYVMDIRNRSSVAYEFQIAEDTYLDMLPRVSLEPLVENALSHGLKNARRKDKKVTIRAEHQGEELWVTVADNGVGTNPQEIRRKLMDEKSAFGEKGHSIGLTNINSRLKLLYGSSCGLMFESKEGEGSKVTIRVPILGQEDVEEWLQKHTGF